VISFSFCNRIYLFCCTSVSEALVSVLFDGEGNRKYLVFDELIRFYLAVNELTDHSKRAFGLVLFFSGCRLSEVLELTPKAVDYGAGFIVIRTLKQHGKKRFRAIPMPNEVMNLLKQIIEADNITENAPIWSFSRWTGWRLIKNLMQSVGIKGIKGTPKGLRHTYTITYLREKTPVTTVSKLLGHARVQTTAIYADFMAEDERKWAENVWNTIVTASAESLKSSEKQVHSNQDATE